MGKEEKNEIKELFQELKKGNKEKLTELYNKCHKVIYGIAFSILKNKEDAEDIVQQVFEKLIKLDKEKLPNDKETTWLYTVTKNETINFWKNKKADLDLEEIYSIEDENNDIEDLIDIETYNGLISGLSNQEKEIVSLKVLSDLSFSEIGNILGEPTGTIKWRYYKAVNTLKMTLSSFAMFLVTFALSIVTFKNSTKDLAIKDSIVQDQTGTIENKEESKENSANGNFREEQDTSIDSILGDLENSTSASTIVTPNESINYIGFGFLGLSTIFLVLTITFAIFLGKRRLNSKKKSS